MKKLLKILLFLLGLLLGAYGILRIALPFAGVQTQAQITEVIRPLPWLQDLVPGPNLQVAAFTLRGEDGKEVPGFSLRWSPARSAEDIGETAGAFTLPGVPRLSALEADAGPRLSNAVMAGVGLLLALLMLPWKRWRAAKYSRTVRRAGAAPGRGVRDARTEVGPPARPVQFQRTVILCPVCTAPVRTGQNFCQECGASIRGSRVEDPAPPAQAEADVLPDPAAAPASKEDRPPVHRTQKPRHPRRAARVLRAAAVLLLLAGIAVGIRFRQPIVSAAAHFYFDNQWRFARDKAEDEQGIRTMLNAAAKALASEDAAAAGGYAFPSEEKQFRARLDSQPGYMAAMAAYLGNVRGIRLGEAFITAYGYSARPAEVTTSLSGREFTVQLLKMEGTWYLSGL